MHIRFANTTKCAVYHQIVHPKPLSSQTDAIAPIIMSRLYARKATALYIGRIVQWITTSRTDAANVRRGKGGVPRVPRVARNHSMARPKIEPHMAASAERPSERATQMRAVRMHHSNRDDAEHKAPMGVQRHTEARAQHPRIGLLLATTSALARPKHPGPSAVVPPYPSRQSKLPAALRAWW